MNVRLSIALVALALLVPGLARADMVDFSYTVSTSPQIISGSGGAQADAFYTPMGTNSAVLGSATGPGFGGVYWQFSTPSGTPPGYVDATADVRLTLTDLASGRSGQLDFLTHLRGAAGGPGVFNSQPVASFSTDIQSVQLGGHLYHITPFGPVEPANGPFIPAVAFTVSVTSAVNAPEPSSLALGAVAGLGLAVRRWRRGRAARGLARTANGADGRPSLSLE